MEFTCSISVGSPDECRMGATLMGASHAIPLFPAAQPQKHPITASESAMSQTRSRSTEIRSRSGLTRAFAWSVKTPSSRNG